MKKLVNSIICLLTLTHSFSQITESQLDELVERSRSVFNVPGIAVAIIKDGKIVISKGYGVTNIKTNQKVDENTLFGIASNSKAFTAAALAILIEEGKLKWDDKVCKILPDFKMYNDYVTKEFTIRDLLIHKSGLGLGAGDLMIWPDGHNFTPTDIVKNIRFLKPISGFRTKYDYDNLLYVIAGEVVAKVSGMSWCDFVENRIMKPIGMTHSAASFSRLKDTSNVIVPHVPINGKLEVIPRYKNHIFDAAAGLYASSTDLSQWLILQMNEGKFGDKTIFSESQHKEMWTPQTLMPYRNAYPYTTLFRTYGLGWQLNDVNGHLQVSHTGGLDGIVTQSIMIPDIKLGIIVLTNQQNGAAFNAISNTIKDAYLGLPYFDHVKYLSEDRRQKEDDADKITDEVWDKVQQNIANPSDIPPVKPLLGTYKDNWFGEVEISIKKGKLYFASKRSPRLCGELFYYKKSNYVVKWDIRSFNADAHVFIETDKSGKVIHFTMKAISPLTDFSYDFHDLDFRRVTPKTAKKS